MSALPTFDPGFTTPEMTDLFSATARIRSMLRFEAALAGAEAAEGIFPAATADEIAEGCATGPPDADGILAEGWEAGTPVLPLLSAIEDRLSGDAVRWLHYGTTTQDVVDTGLMIQTKSALGVLEQTLGDVAGHLRQLATAHRATPMMARTFLQHAAPTTFGLRAAQWLDPTVRHLVDVSSAADGLPIQFGGPSGNLTALGEHGEAVTKGVARRLGLTVPVVPWHTDRSRVAAVVALVDRTASTMAKIGTDLALLAQTDVAEVRMREGGSSSMSHKRNPIDAVRAVAAAEACHACAGTITSRRGHELDRGIGGWHVEWLTVPLVFHTGAAAVSALDRALEPLAVDVDRMAANISGEVDTAIVAAASVLIDRVLAAHDEVLARS